MKRILILTAILALIATTFVVAGEIVTASFPSATWDGTSTVRSSRLYHRDPLAEDWNSISAETIAVENFIRNQYTLVHAGKSSAGALTLTGTLVGDRLIAAWAVPTAAAGAMTVYVPVTDFERTITVADQIQQVNATDLSGKSIVFLLSR